MNNEIKEIIGNLKHYLIEKKEDYEYGCVDSISIDMYYDEIKTIVDYITNLQERIAYLERSNNRREDEIMSLRNEINDYEDYKSRIDKAIEYIIKNSELYDEDLCTANYFELRDLLNILEESDKE